MARQTIDIGVQGNDGTGDSIREGFRKVNDNFRDLYAVFGQGDLIKSTSLDDFPSTYGANQVFITNDFGDNVLAKNIVGGNGISIDNTSETQIVITSTATKLGDDVQPSLMSPLDAATMPIGRVASPTDTAVTLFNATHGTNITADDLVMPRGYADQRYVKADSSSTILGRQEPGSTTEYTKPIASWANGNAVISGGHGLDGATNGRPYVFETTGIAPGSLVSGTTYYVRYVSATELSLHPTEDDARNGTNKIAVPDNGTGTETLVNGLWDETLEGNYLSNEVLPRKSVVRRQGDKMEGSLYLNDHPFPLTGAGTPNGSDDLLAVTKFYVDNSSFASEVNLYVSETGDDAQTNVATGKEGKAPSYAYRSIAAACKKAAEILENAKVQLGPLAQKITYTTAGATTNTTIQSGDFTGGNSSWTAARELLEQNKEYIKAETLAWIASEAADDTAPYVDFTFNDTDLWADALSRIIDAVKIDALTDGNIQTVTVARTLLADMQMANATGTKLTQVLNAISYAKTIANYVLQESNPPATYQTAFTRTSHALNTTLAQRDLVDDKFDIVVDIVQNANASTYALSAGSGVFSMTIKNGGTGPVNQGNAANLEIIPGRLIRGVESGAIARVVTYVAQSAANVDTITCSLLNGKQFKLLEELELASPNTDMQITINVESGSYFEHLPIRVPANVTIRGDSMGRTMVRPLDMMTASEWADIKFYRDPSFDGLDLVSTSYPNAIALLEANKKFLRREIITWMKAQVTGSVAPFVGYVFNEGEYRRDIGRIIDALIADLKYGGNGETAAVAALYYDGTTFKIPGGEAETAAVITKLQDIITDYVLPKTAYTPLQTVVPQVTTGAAGEAGAITKTDTLLSSVVAVVNTGLSALPTIETPKYGRHYLTYPLEDMNVGPAYTVGVAPKAARLVQFNKNYIVAQALAYITANAVALNTTPGVTALTKDLVNIVDAVSNDLKNGDSLHVKDFAARYLNPTGATSYLTNAIITFVGTVFADVLTNAAVVPDYATTATQVVDASLTVEAGAIADAAELISSITYAFNAAYNPPKNNRAIDTFMLNNGSKLQNIIGQGHGGFMCVLDPESVIEDESPSIVNCSSVSATKGAQAFVGGLLVDGFAGRIPAKITSVAGSNLTLSGVTRQPKAPTSFFYQGDRYQVDDVTSWNSGTGVAVVKLSASTPWTKGNLNITLETPGNKTVEAAGFTQVNDLGYGIVAHNTGVTEQSSTFTYYCYSGYFANNGGQIRSLSGSSSYGEYGLRAAGADPTELPDEVTLNDSMVQTAKVYRVGVAVDDGGAATKTFYMKRYTYVPTTGSEVEIDHGLADGSTRRYELTTVAKTGVAQNTYTYRITGATQAAECVITINGGANRTITGATKASPVVITSTGHNIVDGDLVTITGVVGMTELNGGTYYADQLDANTFALYTDSARTVPLDGTDFTAYTSGGTASLGIKFHEGDRVAISGVGGMTALNGNNYYVKPVTAYTFKIYTNATLTTAVNSSGFGAYTSGGTVNETITYTMNAATKANPCRVTFTAAHNFVDGDLISISGVVGMTQLNGNKYYTKYVSTTQVDLYSDSTLVTGVNSTAFGTYTSGGSVTGGKEVLLITLGSNSAEGREANGFVMQVPDDLSVQVRNLSNFRVAGMDSVATVRPSTAFEFDIAADVYRVIAFNTQLADGAALSSTGSILTTDNSFDYIELATSNTQLNTVDPGNGAKTMGSLVGDTKIAVANIASQTTIDALNTGTMVFAWGTKVHKVLSYTAGNPSYVTTEVYDDNYYINGTVGIDKAFPAGVSTTLRVGLPAGAAAQLTTKISTCRVIGHDFLDIGTGGVNTTNSPNNIFGTSTQTKSQTKEVVEQTKGRVFFVSTDQDGTFRVGKYLTVDQGTGTVAIAASIALSNLDGIGFKRGVTVSEFSTDSSMLNNASDTVPTQSAVRGYIDKRLGLDASDAVVAPIGPGFVALNGSTALTGDLNLGGNQITNLGAPGSNSDAATKLYVDTAVAGASVVMDSIEDITNIKAFTPAGADVLLFTGTTTTAVSGGLGGHVTGSFGSANTGTLSVAIATTLQSAVSSGITVSSTTGFPGTPATRYVKIGDEIFSYNSVASLGGNSYRLDGVVRTLLGTTATTHSVGANVYGLEAAQLNVAIANNVIVDAHVSSSAAIAQSKLALSNATAAASAGAATKGIASFDSASFDSTSGFVSLKAGGVDTTKLAAIAANSLIANNTAGSAVPTAVTFATVSPKILDASFTSNGVLKRTGASTYGVEAITTNGAADSLVKTDSTGVIDVQGVKLNNNSILSFASTTLSVKTPGGLTIISANGNDASTATVTLSGQIALSAGSTLNATTVSNGVYTTGSYANPAWITSLAGSKISGALSVDSITKTGTNGTGDIGQSNNKFANVYATTFQGTATSANYADLAEYYTTDKAYEPGTVLVFGGTAETTTTTTFGDTRVAGVVSTNPGFIMNDTLTGTRACIALQGRVPCKVVGTVKKGDLLTTAGIAGHAAKAVNPQIGTIIGKALEDKNYSEAGVIEVAVGRV